MILYYSYLVSNENILKIQILKILKIIYYSLHFYKCVQLNYYD